MMFDWLEEFDLATRLENAVAEVIKEGKVAKDIQRAVDRCPHQSKRPA